MTNATPPVLDAARAALARGDAAAAEAGLQAHLADATGDAEAWQVHAEAALLRGDLAAATSRITRSLGLDSRLARSWYLLGRIYVSTGQFAQVIEAVRRTVTLDPAYADAWVLAGVAFDESGAHADAADAFGRALALPNPPPRTHARLASARLAAGDIEGAESAARAGIEAEPGEDAAWRMLGDILAAREDHVGAVAALREAVARDPANAQNQYNLALLLDETGAWHEAARACEAALARESQLWPALSQLVFLRRRLCEWDGLDQQSARLRDAVRRGAEGITPFSFLSEPATPAEQLACARSWALRKQAEAGGGGASAVSAAAAARRVLRVGFASSGFNNHPTAVLVAELIERLRETNVLSYGFATAADDGGPMRRRLRAGFHEFHDLASLSYPQMAERIRVADVDVLVDLRGYGGGAVTEVFARRPAPIQVNWLAYPGTSGAPFIDYLVADSFVVPAAQRPHYSEALVRLPHAFQPSDTTRAVREPPSRTDCGLPARGFVFASFNNSYKIAPDVFACWMRILRGTPDSVLWLLAGRDEQHTVANLQREAAAAGVQPVRLVFQRKLPHEEYLARIRHVGLFLDTWPYGAHTTASDALWAGAPILTLPGESFASRVAGSLLTTLDLPELIAADADDYVRRALALAADAAAMGTLRTRLERARRESPLFDMARFARDFQRAMLGMIERRRRGDVPADFDLAPTP
jgi:predicted O-linked N-acetylglucosamine transferase (SPINDLY family)